MNLIKRCRYGLMVFNQKDIWQGRSFEVYGEFSESEVSLFRRIVQPGWTALDVGANIGSLTVPLARFVGPTGGVLAFEPERSAYYALCGNVAVNNLRQVVCLQHAVGDHTGSIAVPELDHERTLNFGGLELDRDYSGSNSYTVMLNAVDALHLSQCHFIKVDVEGMEADVLRGAAETIAGKKPVLYVENDREAKAEQLLKVIDGFGYRAWKHDAPLFNPSNFCEHSQNVFGPIVSANLLCVHRDVAPPVDPAEFGMQPVLA